MFAHGTTFVQLGFQLSAQLLTVSKLAHYKANIWKYVMFCLHKRKEKSPLVPFWNQKRENIWTPWITHLLEQIVFTEPAILLARIYNRPLQLFGHYAYSYARNAYWR